VRLFHAIAQEEQADEDGASQNCFCQHLWDSSEILDGKM
jgi:hypothetical protein